MTASNTCAFRVLGVASHVVASPAGDVCRRGHAFSTSRLVRCGYPRAPMARTWLHASLLFVALAACQPKQPLQPSFFTQKAEHRSASCKQTLACYDACTPLTEECMLLCDQKSDGRAVEKARAVSYCGSQHGCVDQTCSNERCAPELEACTASLVAPAPSPMQPQPYPGQAGQAYRAGPMQPQPYPGQPTAMRPAYYGPPGPPPPPPPPGYRYR